MRAPARFQACHALRRAAGISATHDDASPSAATAFACAMAARAVRPSTFRARGQWANTCAPTVGLEPTTTRLRALRSAD